MLTQKDIDHFYKDVEHRKFKFPIAVIAKATGYSKGNVSEYLGRKKEPSESFIKRYYEAFPVGSTEVLNNGVAEEPKVPYGNEAMTGQIIFNLSESGRQNAVADRVRAEAELLREQNTKRMIDLIVTENDHPETQITLDAIAPGLQELIVSLGLGKNWKSREEGFAAVRSKLFAPLKKKKVKDTRND